MTDERRSNGSTRRGFVKAAGLGVLGATLAGSVEADARPARRPRELALYVGTYTSGGSEGIYLYRLDLADGSLEHAGTTAGVVNPSYLTPDRGRRFLYAVNEVEEFGGAASGAVSAFAVDRKTGALRFLNQRASKGGAPCYVTVAADGRFVLVANYVGGNVAV
ncbi:MAG TPA: beta-propeller fold lactonase family protein, partial [Pyrinomonadaceae bacterium]|nr:beta-propeller fold lactonase family protein [Pyrinomonadaceae bacterium]